MGRGCFGSIRGTKPIVGKWPYCYGASEYTLNEHVHVMKERVS